MKKTALALALMFAFLIPSVANAEFVRSYSSNDPSINYTHFFLRVYSPDNDQTCKSTMLLNFSVEWTDYPFFAGFPSPPAPVMKGLYSYTIDNNPAVTVGSNQSSADQFDLRGFKVNPTFSYLLDVSNLTNGYHKIVITVGLTHNQSYVARYINKDTPIQFLVQNPTPTHSASPIPPSEVSQSSENWVEVARFTGSGYQQYYTDYFTCDHREWRIRWEYIPEPDSDGFAYFNVVVYPERALFVVDSILSKGGNDTNGISYTHDMRGMFFMGITAGAAESYTIIVEQDLNSIPELHSWTSLLVTLVAVLFVAVVYRKRLAE